MVTRHKTYCRHCPSGCGLEVDVIDNRIVGLKGERASPTQGYSCMMGQHNVHVYDSRDRLLTAPKRQLDGRFRDIDTFSALEDIARRLTVLLRHHGPQSIALHYGTGTAYGGLA